MRRGDIAMALLVGAWAFTLLRAFDSAAAVVLGLLVVAALLFVRRHTVVSGFAVAAVIAAANFAFGVPSDNPWFLAAALVALYAAGRHGAPPATLPVPVAFWAVLASLDPTMATALFAVVLVGAPWALGHVLRRRAARADRAGEQAAALARVDPDARAQRVVAEERARLAADVLAVIRAAVGRMQAEAGRAQDDLDPGALTAIQEEGRHATGELRRMLGLLRSESPGDGTSAEARNDAHVGRRWRVDALAAVAVAVVYALETAAAANAGGVRWTPALVAPGLWLIAAVALRRTRPATACLVGAVTPVSALVFDLRLGYGLWSAAAAALLVSSVMARRDRATFVAMGVFATAFLWDVLRQEPDNAAITLATLVLAGIVGYGWGDRTRAARTAEAASSALLAQHEAVAEQALRADRLKLARELHDLTSHAVGVMVLQAGAAAALRDRDPARARDALRISRSAAAEALSQVDGLFELLDAGTVGSPGLAATVPAADLNEALAALVDRLRNAGLRVRLDHSELSADDPVVLATAYRIVQESLTNAMRHAPGSAVHVCVRPSAGGVEITVHDDGGQATPSNKAHGGFGLVGLAERVAALGGEIRTGPRTDGGYEVRALLPVNGPVEIHR